MPKYVDVESLHFPNICIFDMKLHGATVPMVRLVDLQKLVPAADAIEELSKPRWIPVTERLPEEYIPVLVCFDFKGRKSVDVAELWSDGGFHNYSDEYLTPEGRKHRKGTHWMPLPSAPEPPKEET